MVAGTLLKKLLNIADIPVNTGRLRRSTPRRQADSLQGSDNHPAKFHG